MRRLITVVALVLAVGVVHADPLPSTPITQDPLGPMTDVTANADYYQPRAAFCVKTDVFQYPGPGPVVNGTDPDCAASGFTPERTGLVKISVGGPALCDGCRRLFIDFSKIPANAPPLLYAHGHAYFHLSSLNPTYTVEPAAHSPNIKNFTNDKLFVPEGSPHQPFVYAFDNRNRAYTGNTAHFVHNADQGPYYTGPWYVNRDGVRINGAYLDVMIDPAPAAPPEAHQINEIGYGAGFHSGEQICFDEILGGVLGDQFRDGDGFYGGCFDGVGAGSTPIDPYAGS